MEFDDLLIKEVKKYPNLYDNTCLDYKDSYKKELAWQNLADALGQSASACQQRWKVLRERYVREKKQLDIPWSANHCRIIKHPWPYMDQMCFLNSYIRHRNRSIKNNIDFPEIVIQEDNEISITDKEDNESGMVLKQENADDDISELKDCSESVSSFNDVSNYVKKRKISNHEDKSVTNNCGQASLSLTCLDEDDLFCLSIAATLKHLSPEEKSCAKLHILQILHELHQQWLLDRQDLIRERQHDLQILNDEEYQKLFIFFSNLIQALGEQLKVRQQVIATATVYFKRFYSRNSLKCIDPLLLAPTCIFLASKVEEFGVISNSRLISTCQTVVKNKFTFAYTQEFPYRINHVLECEFYLLEMMDCCLVLYQPYRPLMQYIADLGHEETLLPLAWRIVNDSLRTDVCLLYPPYQIALASIHMACVVLQKDVKQWFSELNIDMEKILEITRHVLGLYDLWKNFDEKKEIQPLLAKMPRPKTQPPRQ
ncbi:Cyclin-C [Nymphon striatum]|nr:Cyclin-C [Nymphon striatum]